MLDNTSKNWVEVNDDTCGTYKTNSQVEFKISTKTLCFFSCLKVYYQGGVWLNKNRQGLHEDL